MTPVKSDAVWCEANEPLAIIAMACRFPGGSSTPETYWRLLRSGGDAVIEVPGDRWDLDRFYDRRLEASGETSPRFGGFLKGVDRFDPQFFGISPREAVSMDPQQRLMLEIGWEAIERAGLAPSTLAESRTGVFVGVSTYDYSLLNLTAPEAQRGSELHRVTGSAVNIIAGRLSYTLGLQGPSMVVDTACSSSLVAVHLAGQSLRTGECDLALAGGVSLMLVPDFSVMFSKAHMLSPGGRCKTFDAAADGFVRGEGCGIVVLRRLSDAISNRDPILALLRGSAVNQDGRSGGLTAPNGPAQQAVIRQALANARLSPAKVGYVETHGTGTALGDPIEVGALATVLGQGRCDIDPVRLGAVKTNIGHLEAAAGIAGLIKTVLVLQHREIPPNLHLQQPNPHIHWDTLPVRLPTGVESWPTGDQPRIAGVSSFGISGTNAHVILSEAPPTPGRDTRPSGGRQTHLLCLSARDKNALNELAADYQRYLARHPSVSLLDVAHTAHVGRSHFSHRAALTAGTAAEMIERLATLTKTPPSREIPETISTAVAHEDDPPVAFLFSGQGVQYPEMCRQLYGEMPVFRTALQHCDDVLREHFNVPLLSILYESGDACGALLHDTTYTQPALFAVEYALAQVWRSWGIKPSAVLGHSMGEYAAACVAGVLSLEDGLALIAGRARLMGNLPADGAMAAVFASESKVASAIAPYPGALAIAAINGPADTVISGTLAAVDEVSSLLRAEGIRVQRLPVSHAFHSPLLDPMLDNLEQLADSVSFRQPRIDMISNLTGRLFPRGSTVDPAYLRRHAREPVRFREGILSLYKLGYRLFVEVGPQPVLLGMGRRCLPEDAAEWLPSVRKSRDEQRTMLESLGALYLQGVPVDWAGFDRDVSARKILLPTYPFQRQSYWQRQEPGKDDTSRAISEWLYRVAWRPQRGEAPNSHPGQIIGRWTIFADRGGVGQALADLMHEQGAQCEVVFGDTRNGTRLPARLTDSRGIIHLWGLDATEPDQQRQCGSVLEIVQALAETELPQPPRLWLVTRGAQPIRDSGEDVAIAQAPLWGLGRVIALEHPQLWGGLVDLDPAGEETAAVAATRLLGDVCTDGMEDQVGWRDGQRRVARLSRVEFREGMSGPSVRPDATYAITGGQGALGRAVAAWLARRGARHIALISRGVHADCGPPAEQLSSDVEISVIQADVAVPEQLAAAFKEIERTMPPLRGVVHAAGVLEDGLLTGHDWPQFERVLAPKVRGAWNLHLRTRGLELDFFVLFSSVASLLGSPGQASYAAANSFLDALAHHRRANGLPALCINWGPWDAGMAATASEVTRQRWRSTGMGLLSPAEATAAMGALMGTKAAQIAVLRIDWTRHATADGGLHGGSSMLADLVTTTERPAPQSGVPRLVELRERRPDQRRGFLLEVVRHYAGSVLGIATEEVPTTAHLPGLGVDSLMVMELARLIKRDFHLTLYPREIYEHSTVERLASYLDGELAPAPLAPSDTGIVFLLSSPRSGSTLLRVMLAGHSQLFCPPELHLLPFETLTHQRHELAESYLHEGLQRALMELDGTDAAQSEAVLQRWADDGLPVVEVYRRLMKMAAPRILVDKSPTYATDPNVLKRAEALFPNAKYLCLVRHPHAAVESFTRMRMHRLIGKSNQDSFEAAQQIWTRANQNILELMQRVDADRHHLVRYEDLVRLPEQTIGKVCEFLGISTEAATLQPYDGRRMTDGVHGGSLSIGDPNFLNHERIEPDLADVWRKVKLPLPLGSAAQRVAARLGYRLPSLNDAGEANERPCGTVPERAFQEQRVTANGLGLSVLTWGQEEDPAIICVHGSLDHAMAWEEVATGLSEHGYRVIVPDLRGHGRSDHAPPGSYQLINYVADLQALIHHLPNRRFVLAGHSMGAAVAAIYASLRPERVGGLVLIEGSLPGESTDITEVLDFRLQHLTSSHAHAALPDISAAADRLRHASPNLAPDRAVRMAQRLTRPCPDGVCWRWDPALLSRADLRFDQVSLTSARYRAVLARITVPTTLIYGDASSSARAWLKSAIPSTTSILLPGGHNLHIDAPAVLADAVVQSAAGAGIGPTPAATTQEIR